MIELISRTKFLYDRCDGLSPEPMYLCVVGVNGYPLNQKVPDKDGATDALALAFLQAKEDSLIAEAYRIRVSVMKPEDTLKEIDDLKKQVNESLPEQAR